MATSIARVEANRRNAQKSTGPRTAQGKAIASRNPDLLTANGGGCNAILVRGAVILEHRARELTRKPERRMMHGVK